MEASGLAALDHLDCHGGPARSLRAGRTATARDPFPERAASRLLLCRSVRTGDWQLENEAAGPLRSKQGASKPRVDDRAIAAIEELCSRGEFAQAAAACDRLLIDSPQNQVNAQVRRLAGQCAALASRARPALAHLNR